MSLLNGERKKNPSKIDFLYIKTLHDKKTKNGKPYRMASVETFDGDFSPIWIWDKKVQLEVGGAYLCKLLKENSFVKLTEAHKYNVG